MKLKCKIYNDKKQLKKNKKGIKKSLKIVKKYEIKKNKEWKRNK